MSRTVLSRKAIASIVFFVVMGGVLTTFIILGAQGHPPDMPKGTAPHTLRFNLKNELIGVETDPAVDLAAPASTPGFVYDKKAVEEHINSGCISCHAVCSDPPVPGAAPCRGRHHPPKTECIKCHRMGR